MRRIFVLSLLSLFVVTVFMVLTAAEAEAVTKSTVICRKLEPRGPLICFSFTTGSEICDIISKGVSSKIVKDCDPNDLENCPLWLECSAFGTYVDGSMPPMEEDPEVCNPESPNYDDSKRCFDPQCDPSDPLYFDPDSVCWMTGASACFNPQGHYNFLGTAFNLAGPLTEVASYTSCTKEGGRCTAQASVDPEGNGGVCNRNWDLAFTAEQFFGQVCMCPGNFDKNGDCCADQERNRNGTCKKLFGDPAGEPGCVSAFCYYDGEFDDYTFENPPTDYVCYETQPE
jgi:hypothetical protein